MEGIQMMKAGRIIVYFCFIVLVIGDENSDSKIVEIAQGPVRGYRDPEGGLFAFYGIPYATAPTGGHKFKAPLPPPTWTQTFEAVDKHIACPQLNISGMTIQEDCLITNVFVPDTNDTDLPVIVYVHGGAFILGHGNQLTPKHLVRSQNIIVVTFNYRLGVHGFLCLGTDDAPGNAGMKDQVAALHWVNKNIINFGGNPDDVTIAGYSAGATSVDLLAISESAQGLFHKVIIESGSNLMAGGLALDPLENARTFAASLGFTELHDINALELFYKEASYDSLINLAMDKTDSTSLFSSCIERDTEEEPFLTDAPINILKNNEFPQVPMLYGFSNMEGIFREPYFETWKILMNENFADFLPGDLHFESFEEKEEVAKDVKEFYFGNDSVNEENILSYIHYFGDVIFKYPVLRTAKMYLENGHVKMYLYEYSFTDDDVPVIIHTDVRGATHCAQTLAVLDGVNDTVKHEDDISNELRKVKNSIRTLWANFAKTGSPVPAGSELTAWPATSAQLDPFMEITEPLQLGGALMPREVQFWDDIYARHYRMPIPPTYTNSAVNFHIRGKIRGFIVFLVALVVSRFI